MGIPGSSAEVWNNISDMDSDRKQRLVVSSLVLDHYDSDPKSCGGEYYKVLFRIIRSVYLSEIPLTSSFITPINQHRSRSPKLTHLAWRTHPRKAHP